MNSKRRVVVKIGTSTITHKTGKLNLRRLDTLARVMTDLRNAGSDLILVSSGAIATGAGTLGLASFPNELRFKQAAAAVGQCRLMHVYDKLFGEYGQQVAQILLSRQDIDEPDRRHNLISTFEALLEWGVLPVVNENDSVTPEEIEHAGTRIFGDNDTLSAVVAKLVGADLLVLLTDIDGLYDSDPRENPSAALIPEVSEITDALRAASGGAGSARGTGGMITKLSAASIALESGFEMVIARGDNPEALYDIAAGKKVGTRFRQLTVES